MPPKIEVAAKQRANRKVWSEALRSGEYEKCTHALRDENRYCVLGVGCDLTGFGKWESGINDKEEFAYKEGEYFSFTNMSSPIIFWYGLASSYGQFLISNEELVELLGKEHPALNTLKYVGNKRRCSLIYLNDNGISFNKLADIIDREPEGLLDPYYNV